MSYFTILLPPISNKLLDILDNEHAPIRLKVPGVNNAVRYRATDGQAPTWLTLFDTESPDVVQSEEYRVLRAQASERERACAPQLSTFNRGYYEQIFSKVEENHPGTPGKYIMVVSMLVRPEIDDEFNQWYNTEHVPDLAKTPGWHRSRRFKLLNNVEFGKGNGVDATKPPHNYLAIHDFDHDGYIETSEFVAAVQTAWSGKVLSQVSEYSYRKFSFHKVIEKS